MKVLVSAPICRVEKRLVQALLVFFGYLWLLFLGFFPKVVMLLKLWVDGSPQVAGFSHLHLMFLNFLSW